MIQKFLLTLSFFTRIPIGNWDFGSLTLAQSIVFFPIAGALIGLLSGGFYIEMIELGLPSNISAWLVIGFQLLLTGGLHEDGLADTADGLASGRDRTQKLAIMHDSRIGSYGVLALITTISLRANIIAGFAGGFTTVFIFITTAACSRAFLAIFMYKIEYARDYGLAVTAGKTNAAKTLAASALGCVTLLWTGKILAAITTVFALAIIYVVIKQITIKNFGGITGDTLGAAQQISEVALLLIFLIYSHN
jgi:adenosylcobinamide-GDP ribazoletransferase